METSFHVVGVGFGLGTKAVRRYLANSASATTGLRLPLVIFAFVGSVLVSVRARCCMQDLIAISPAVNVVSHSVHLRIRTATSIDSIPDTDVLPHHYFEFCDYEELDTTDRFYWVAARHGGKNNQRSQPIFEFNAYKCEGRLQLSSSAATYMYLNPATPLTEALLNSFKSDSGISQKTKLQQMAGKKTLDALEENTITIAELLQKQQQELAVRTLIYKTTLSYKISSLLSDVRCLIHKNDQNCIT
ncbi:hypothetical protein L1987_21964 [Smallanthus sonchifolius]|uniref:Uncharacterized protein n=1 Tax=Smallanthus sonchifolius TaxID=185202 RepID=A0ACB9IE52_9ASTR|nr:hypothetical protein L1987_21964 [Smallanthus sonchifolius]